MFTTFTSMNEIEFCNFAIIAFHHFFLLKLLLCSLKYAVCFLDFHKEVYVKNIKRVYIYSNLHM